MRQYGEVRTRNSETMREWHFPCECGDWHYIHLQWHLDDGYEGYLDIADAYQPRRWGDRVRIAYQMLRGDVHMHRGIVLTRDAVNDLRGALDDVSTARAPEPSVCDWCGRPSEVTVRLGALHVGSSCGDHWPKLREEATSLAPLPPGSERPKETND